MPNILLLGAGLVAPPFVDYMLRRAENNITIACRTLDKAKDLARGRPNVHATTCDVTSGAEINALVEKCDIVISLVPYIHHADIIAAAVEHGKNFVSTSYVSPAMLAFDEAAKAKGLVMMNEIGVDPGVDHLYAKRTIDEVHSKGGKVVSFESYCGGLPAPECSNNPLGYKFSWSPRGVFLAVRNEAKFKQNGQVVTIPGPDLLRKGAKRLYIYPAFATYGYPNRDSSFYDARYNMPECHTCLRGTLRYEGNVDIVQCLADIGFLSLDEVDYLQPTSAPLTWINAVSQLVGAAAPTIEDVQAAIVEKAGLSGDVKDLVLSGLKWFGLFSENEAPRKGTPLDSLCATLETQLQYKEGERDMVLLQHLFGIEWSDGSKETRASRLLEYGKPGGDQAMAWLVGMPCGVATQLILDGVITQPGIHAPLAPEFYNPIIEKIEEEGVKVVDEIL